VALLGVQADEDFNAALALDPTNWEAQFDKASALSHWPAGMNKGPEVIQRLSALITQQETMAPQPEFAQTYLLLGEQYQAAGQGEKAAQIWQQGAALFPLNPAFQPKLARAANP
jgi:tetratricopeptide (TPR) repeat protein